VVTLVGVLTLLLLRGRLGAPAADQTVPGLERNEAS
jgi:hypothetical protein